MTTELIIIIILFYILIGLCSMKLFRKICDDGVLYTIISTILWPFAYIILIIFIIVPCILFLQSYIEDLFEIKFKSK